MNDWDVKGKGVQLCVCTPLYKRYSILIMKAKKITQKKIEMKGRKRLYTHNSSFLEYYTWLVYAMSKGGFVLPRA